MATEVKLPRLGQGMESGIVTKWLKAEGDSVSKGEPLYEVETEKATQEVEAEANGVLLKIVLAEGEAPVGQIIAVIGEAGESVDVAAPAPNADEPAAAKEPEPTPEPAKVRPLERLAGAPTADPADGRIKASPLARRKAREAGIDLSALRGTGPDGRIIAEDVEQGPPAPVEAAPALAPVAVPVGDGVESIPLTKIRSTIARRLTAAWEIPVFTLTVSVDMTPANELITKAREMNPDVKVTVTDLLAKVCAQSLIRHPEVNVQFTPEALLQFRTANVGIAAAAPQGLVVPVIRSVERLSLAETAARRTDIIGRARENKLQQSDLEEGTFTISNLGMYGVEQFVAVLNPPQAAILAVGATEDRVVAVDGTAVIRPMMTVTLTVDHRAVDGAPAADFLKTVKLFLEEPALAL